MSPEELIEELRAELAKAGDEIRAYEGMLDGLAEKAATEACEAVKDEFRQRDVKERLSAARIAQLESELARLCTPRPSEPLEMDCGDSSCLFAKTHGGMRTNGGCRCLQNLGFCRGERESLRRMAAEILTLRAAQTPRPIAEAPKDGTWVLVYWDTQPHEAPIVVQGEARGWWDGFRYVEPPPTHFLPLPVTR